MNGVFWGAHPARVQRPAARRLLENKLSQPSFFPRATVPTESQSRGFRRAAENNTRAGCAPRILLCALLLTTLPARAQEAEDQPIVDAPTEALIDGALAWLAQKQAANGSWNDKGDSNRAVAMTGYTLMAFMAAGNLPTGGAYAKEVGRGVQFLLDSMQPDGLFRGVDGGKYMYSHGIATIALAEVYGQTRSEALRTKLERAIQLIVTSQSEDGGWRYRPASKDADISVTVLQVAALRGAKNSGIDVPQATLDEAVAYVRRCAKDGGFGYQPGKGAGFATTAAAMYSLQVSGLYDDPLVEPASKLLFKKMDEKKWNTYGHNYAAPAQYLVGGETWRDWYGKTKAMIAKSALREGGLVHWERREENYADPLYFTAIYATILAMPYNYIPLYQR